MLVVFLTTLPMTLIRPNLFLCLVAVFSFYLVLTGWQRARSRRGASAPADWLAASVMAVAAIPMTVLGVVMIRAGDTRGIGLLAFAGIGGGFAVRDLLTLRGQGYRGQLRIAAHLTRMLGGTIAAVTAFTVVNVRMEPAFMVWLAPTVVLTPLIVYWNFRVRAGR